MTIVNDIAKVESDFFRNLGDGRKAAANALTIMQSVATSRDTMPVANLIRRSTTEKRDDDAAKFLQFLMKQVFPGHKLSKDDNGQYTFKIKGVKADQKKLDNLSEAVDRGLSMRGITIRRLVEHGKEDYKPAAKKFDVSKWSENQAKAHTLQELDAMIAALQAARKTKEAAALKAS